MLLSSGLTQEGKGIRHLNCISQRAHIIEKGNVAVMGNILKIIVCGHLEFSHPLQGVLDKLPQQGLEKKKRSIETISSKQQKNEREVGCV